LRWSGYAGLKAVEIHYPSDPEVRGRVTAMAREFGVRLNEFVHPHIERVDERSNSYAWLLAQLAAFDASDIIFAAGGRLGGSASMLLWQAEAKQRPMAPLGHLGGAAAASLERQRYRLLDRLGSLSAWLQNPHPVEKLQSVLDALVSRGGRALRRGINEAPRVFISYARQRPEEADLAEMTLRRRGLEVFRDEHNFAAGAHLVGEIEEHLAGCDVFIALWSRDYACSP
jgi:hypothetical protein